MLKYLPDFFDESVESKLFVKSINMNKKENRKKGSGLGAGVAVIAVGFYNGFKRKRGLPRLLRD